LSGCGYEVVLVGHSLGAGVAALLAALLLPSLPALRCYGFATPAVASGERLLATLRMACVSVVLREFTKSSSHSSKRRRSSSSCYGFATPAVASGERLLATLCMACVSVVLHEFTYE